MSPKIPNEIREALDQQAGGPLELKDDQNAVYVVMTRQKFQTLVYDDSELTPDEMMAAAAQSLDDPDGWGAPGMEGYDTDNSESPTA